MNLTETFQRSRPWQLHELTRSGPVVVVAMPPEQPRVKARPEVAPAKREEAWAERWSPARKFLKQLCSREYPFQSSSGQKAAQLAGQESPPATPMSRSTAEDQGASNRHQSAPQSDLGTTQRGSTPGTATERAIVSRGTVSGRFWIPATPDLPGAADFGSPEGNAGDTASTAPLASTVPLTRTALRSTGRPGAWFAEPDPGAWNRTFCLNDGTPVATRHQADVSDVCRSSRAVEGALPMRKKATMSMPQLPQPQRSMSPAAAKRHARRKQKAEVVAPIFRPEAAPPVLRRPGEVNGKAVMGRDVPDRAAEEKEFVLRHDSNCPGPDGMWYLIDAAWLKQWRHFVSGDGFLPGRIENLCLLDNMLQPKVCMKLERNYNGVNKKVWEYFQERYGGGPALPSKELNIYACNAPQTLGQTRTGGKFWLPTWCDTPQSLL